MFEYLTVFISVIVGLAITSLFTNVIRVIHGRHRAVVYWPRLVWALNIFAWTIAFWWFTLAHMNEGGWAL